MIQPGEVVGFWREAGEQAWFARNEGFDAALRVRFEAAHHAAAQGALAAWEQSREGALALCLLLDQIPRNIYRASPHAFATDGLAQRAAERALAQGFDAATDMPLRIFFYMPFEHAEDMALQQRCVALFKATGDGGLLQYAMQHRDIIAGFGRFPHRNVMLGRASTAEEQAFLDAGGFAG